MSNALSRRTVGTPIIIGGAAAEQSYRARLRRHLANLPDPVEQAYHLTEREIVALRTAWQGSYGMRCEETFRAELFREGLADRAGYLTAFGMAVRRAAMAEDA